MYNYKHQQQKNNSNSSEMYDGSGLIGTAM